MKIRYLALLVLFPLSISAEAASVVQVAYGSGFSGVSATLSSPVTSGNHVVVAAYMDVGATSITIDDDQDVDGSEYTLLYSGTDANTDVGKIARFWIRESITDGPDTFDLNGTSMGGHGLAVFEINGDLDSPVYSNETSYDAGQLTSNVVISVSPTNDDSVAVGLYAQTGGETWTMNANTNKVPSGATGEFEGAFYDEIATAASTDVGASSTGGSAHKTMWALVIEGAAAGGGSVIPVLHHQLRNQ